MKKLKSIMISSLLMTTGITAFAERATNKKVKKKSVVFTRATKEKMYEFKKQ